MNNEELRKLVIEIDDEIQRESNRTVGRELEIIRRLAMRLNRPISNIDPICKETIKIFHELYNMKDVAIPALVIGGYYFKGCIYKLFIGQVYGKVRIDISKIIKDIPELRLKQLFESNEELSIYLDQICDLFDFGLGLDDLKKTGGTKSSIELLDAGKSHLESAVKTALDGVDREASMHNSFLAAELLMKGFLAQKGFSTLQLKKLNHHLIKIGNELCAHCRNIEGDRVNRAIGNLPKSVNERYEISNYTNEMTGKAIMSAQYLAGSVIRNLTDRNLRPTLKIAGRELVTRRIFP